MNFDEAKQSEYVPEQPPEEISVPEMQGKAFGGGEYTGDENAFKQRQSI